VPWEEPFSSLKEFKKREGHCDVPHSHKEDRCNLGSWVNKQRGFKKLGKLNSDRDKLLEEVAFNGWHQPHGTKCMPCSTNS
jgi:hypothetical protein